MMKPVIDAVADTLIECGVRHTFGIPGGGALFLYAALASRQDRITSILARQEGAAACMADAYGRITGTPAAVIAQGAWAASNAAFGILEAYLAGTPMLILTDTSDYAGLLQHGPWQNGTGDYGAFDLPNIMRSMTKYTTVAHSPDELIHGIRLAVKHAVSGRPGPACVCARMGIFGLQVDEAALKPALYPFAGHVAATKPRMGDEDAALISHMLANAASPVIIAGHGVHNAQAHDELRALAELLGAPVATSYMGKSAIEETHALSVGTMGGIGQKVANEMIRRADVLFAVGTGLSPENTMMLSPGLIDPARQRVVQVDIDPRNAGWTYPVAAGAVADAKDALSKIAAALKREKTTIDAAGRVTALAALKAELGFFSCDEFSSDEAPLAPERIVKEVCDAVSDDTVICLDAGNNRQWFAKHFRSKRAGQVLAPGGAGGVGWGPPAAIGAHLARGGGKTACICGDGGMIMMLHCLEAARQYELPVTFIVLNNASLGNIRDFQPPENKFCTEYPEPDIAAYARAAGCAAAKVRNAADLSPALRDALAAGGPSLVEVITKREAHFKLMK
ncbi:MAG TPA: thiamine pyrophosphate-binding protein [Spirochaetota bacterium]|nr:thiamine pyrophosphate-binding protein [Spirochaetota bacterium]HOD13591.1 thiamine pyrophosphate-binding protein [Spirochaetota bacterium]HPG51468.1 thiamine pyrophosphate-binding protein [Spirochaetota bacterium]HPN10421.1 thiamine pyrophosphate-binding protein [Spirochaetota bacterium]